MSLKQKTFTGLIWTFLEQFGRTGIRFVVQLALARLIAPDQFGLLGMIGIFYAVAETLSRTGLNQSLIRMTEPKSIDYNTVFWLNLVLSVFIYIIVFFLAPYISKFYDEPILSSLIQVYALSIIITCFSSIQLTKYTRELNFKIQTTVLIPSIIISSILGITLAKLGYGVWSLVYMQVAQSTISALQLWFRSAWKPQLSYSWERAKYHFNFGYKLMLASLLNNIFINIYPMIIGKYNTASQVGFYTRALSFRNLPTTMVSGMFAKVSYPVMTQLKTQREQFIIVFSKFLKVILLMSSFILFAFIVAAKPLILILIGAKWLPSVELFQWIAFGGIFIVLQNYLTNILSVFGKSDLILKALIYSRLINLVIIIITAPLGIMAIIYGQLLAELVNFMVMQFYCSIILNYSLKKQYFQILPILLPGLFITITILLTFQKVEALTINLGLQLLIILSVFSSFFILAQYILNKKILLEVYKMKNLFKK